MIGFINAALGWLHIFLLGLWIVVSSVVDLLHRSLILVIWLVHFAKDLIIK